MEIFFFYFIRVCVRSVRMSSPATQLKGRLLYKAIKRSLGWYWRREGCIWLGGGQYKVATGNSF